MTYRYYISDKGSEVVEENRLSGGFSRARGDLSDHLLVLSTLNTEYTYSGNEGKTVKGLKRELFAGPSSSEEWLERILSNLYAEGYVERVEVESDEDYPRKSQHYSYKSSKYTGGR